MATDTGERGGASDLVWSSWIKFDPSRDGSGRIEDPLDEDAAPPSEVTCVIEQDPALDPIVASIQKGDLRSARSNLKAFLERQPDHPGASKWLGLLLRHEGERASLEHIQRWRESEGASFEACFEYGDTLLEFGRYEEAEANYRRMLGAPPLLGALMEMAQARAFQGKSFISLLDAAYSIDSVRTRSYLARLWTFPRASDDGESWDAATAASYLGISATLVAELADDGRLPAIVSDDGWRFAESGLSAFVDLSSRYGLHQPPLEKNLPEAPPAPEEAAWSEDLQPDNTETREG